MNRSVRIAFAAAVTAVSMGCDYEVSPVTSSSSSSLPEISSVVTEAPWWPEGYVEILARDESTSEFKVYSIEGGFAEFVGLGANEPRQCSQGGQQGVCVDNVFISRYGCSSRVVEILYWSALGTYFLDYSSATADNPVAPLEPFTISHFLPDPTGIRVSRSGDVVDLNFFMLDYPETISLGC